MTILLDKREGSKELAHHIPRELVRRPLELYNADFSWCGFGPDGVPLSIGGEYKQIADALKSFEDGRFSGEQLPKLLTYDRAYLLIEGAFRPGPAGVLEIRQWSIKRSRMEWMPAEFGGRAWTYRQLDSWIGTLEEKVEYDFGVPLRVWRTWSIEESAAWITDRYLWWTAKPYEDHKSHLKWASKDARLQAARRKAQPRNVLVPTRTVDLPIVQRVAAEFPVIGPDRSVAVAKHFGSVFAMAMANEREWQKVPGIGRLGASRIVKAIQGDESK